MGKQTQIMQAIGSKDEPNIVYMGKPQRTPQQRTQIIVYFFGHIIVCCNLNKMNIKCFKIFY